MKTNIKIYITLFAISTLLIACNHSNHLDHDHGGEAEHQETGEEHEDEVHFTTQQFEALGMKVDTIPLRNMSSYIEANGLLEVPPQNEATITAIIGGNITEILVIEGDKVKKGQVLAYLSHPDLIKLQTDYVVSFNQLQYLESEFHRQKKLYEEKVGSGKIFQKVQADYQAMNGTVIGYAAQLKLIGLKPDRILQGNIYEQVPLVSPIDGHIRSVEVKIGQYVQAQTEIFEIVNIEHIHADLMVFERDIHRVKEGQKVRFTVESSSGRELEAVIYAVGKSFEQDPKAIHLHTEIKNKEGMLIPGMYVRGRIQTSDLQVLALPEASLAREGDKYFIFLAKQEDNGGINQWVFEPIEVIVGVTVDGWIEVKLLAPMPQGAIVAFNNAYYLMAEMKKGENEHED